MALPPYFLADPNGPSQDPPTPPSGSAGTSSNGAPSGGDIRSINGVTEEWIPLTGVELLVAQKTGGSLGNWKSIGFTPRDPSASSRVSTPTDYQNADTAANKNIIDDYIARQNAISNANRDASTNYNTTTGVGTHLLDNLIKLSQDPATAMSPGGLAAFARYGGGAQAIAAGTNGAGIANPNASALDTLLSHYEQLANSVQPPNPSATTAPIDPNKAPALTPEQAAKSPDATSNFGFSSPEEAGAMHDYFVSKGMLPAAARGGKVSMVSPIPAMVVPPGGNQFMSNVINLAAQKYKAAGGKEPDFWNTIKSSVPRANAPASVGVPGGESVTPVAPVAASPAPVATPPLASWSRALPAGTVPPVIPVGAGVNGPIGSIAGFADGGLQMLADAGLDSPEKVQSALANQNDPYAAAINEFGQSDLARHAMRLASHGLEGYGSTAVGDGGKAIGGYQIRTDAHPDISAEDAADPYASTKYMSNDYNLAAERVMREQPDLFKQDPGKASALAAFYAEKPTNMYNEGTYEDLYSKLFPHMATGGSTTIGGEPHFIVDAQGNKVAALTEDGKKEKVAGIGGVEVTPLDPARKAAYEKRKAAGDTAPKEFMATGGSALFPNIPDSMVNTGVDGSNMLPSSGGPSGDRASQVGAYFHPANPGDLPDDLKSSSSQTQVKGAAELLGSALSAGNQAVPTDFLQSLNSGQAPRQLLSANALQSMLPTQRTMYFSLLQSMGLGAPEDNMEMVKRGRPDTMK